MLFFQVYETYKKLLEQKESLCKVVEGIRDELGFTSYPVQVLSTEISVLDDEIKRYNLMNVVE
jgi:hypothetical protein